MDIRTIKRIEKAAQGNIGDSIKIAIVLVFFIIVCIIASVFGATHNIMLLAFATVIGAYMAMNIGANDVANNVGPAVGSRAITLLGAIGIAAFFEAFGAIVAGADVVDTIKSGIIDPASVRDSKVFVAVMLGALLSSAIWLHLATFLGAPVSTTHSLVGGVLGAGIIAGGMEVVKWTELAKIASSWVISPVMGGIFAVLFLVLIKRTITYKENKNEAAKVVVPFLVFFMSWAFGLYLIIKGLSRVLPMHFGLACVLSLVVALAIFLGTRPLIVRKAHNLSNTKEDIGTLFTIPLIFAAAMLSFAHGANDVSNAVGPLAAINQTLESMSDEVLSNKAGVPFWILLIGGLGISIGLALYGPRLIRTVGNEITDLDKIRAFCVAMSAAITVLVASQLGLPVSSTHVTIGAIFGVGFLREYLKKRYYEMQQTIIQAHRGKDSIEVERFLSEFHKASVKRKGQILESLKRNELKNTLNFSKKEKKSLKKAYKSELVKRSAINRIVASWIVTVPISALLGALSYFVIMWIGFEL
ncbi:inorganic phosphate transporter [uncultured Helicobacter sp.]|uniref:inorganic phosphate transporter n=1 Tax=uncultured Helicobacter sp. TaxID=175537 RepID=UPI00375094C7